MKVAFCFAGQPRDVRNTLDNIKKSWGTHQELDFFFHSWIPEKEGPYRIDTPSDVYTKDINDYVLSELSPVKYEFENQITFENFYQDSIHWPIRSINIPNPSQNIQSFFYSIKKCNELKKKYEAENNFTYDCVIRCRFDYLFTKVYNVNDFDLNYLNIKNDCKHTAYAINDHIALSNSKNMDLYSTTFDNIQDHYIKGIEFNTEVILGYNAYVNGLSYHKTLGDNSESYVSTQKERAGIYL
jgi:hypothetical protein